MMRAGCAEDVVVRLTYFAFCLVLLYSLISSTLCYVSWFALHEWVMLDLRDIFEGG